MRPLRIGTRSSALAMWQAHHVQGLLGPFLEGRALELVQVETEGDQRTDVALNELSGDGAFTKAIQTALLRDEVDLAVHSLKDLPTIPIPGLTLASVPERGKVGDAFLSLNHSRFDELPQNATVATSSLRRQAQLLNRRPDLNLIRRFRGNVDTRIRKLRDEGYDAIILAEAGLERLELQEHITEVLSTEWMLPAVGQGALGLECRESDEETIALIMQINDPASFQAVTCERSFLNRLAAGCQAPIGAIATVEEGTLTLRAAVLSEDGRERIAEEISGLTSDAHQLGVDLADRMKSQGAAKLLP